MNLLDFDKIIANFKSHPRSGRNIWLWNGDSEDLKCRLPQDVVTTLDIMSLSVLAQPRSKGDKDIANELNRILSEELQKIRSRYNPPHILLIAGCSLIARYSSGLGPLFNHYVGNGIAAILVVPKIRQKLELPSYISFEPSFTLSYLSGLLGNENVIEVNGND